ncbi:MAG: hypothetical protein A3B17_00270 [Candidatus Yanofskybacteria bacterium RIFCSPLOWO2_01_FULL_45_72]|nr:MAG: hypothetical protein A3B17_00270 [Candidatus Yanofskybacteria bacterium RIFCSPLOWO2_01_FULL_45_72]
MKKLIALISPEGKSKEQLTDEMYEAVQKYFKVEKEVLANQEHESITDGTEKEEGNAFIISSLPKPKSDEQK